MEKVEGAYDVVILKQKIDEIIDHLNSQDQPEKVYVDPIVPNFTEELSAPVEYKTKEEVKRMFEPEKKGWRKEWEDLFSLEYGYPTWEEVPIYKKEILDLIQQELDKAREEGKREQLVNMIEESKLQSIKYANDEKRSILIDSLITYLEDWLSKLKQ